MSHSTSLEGLKKKVPKRGVVRARVRRDYGEGESNGWAPPASQQEGKRKKRIKWLNNRGKMKTQKGTRGIYFMKE